MAKKVTVAELLIKLKVDAKASAKALRDQQTKIKKLQSQIEKQNKAQQTQDKKRMQNLKVYLAGSRELHKLRKSSPRDALRFEKALEKAYKTNNRIKIAETKKNIGLKLQEKKIDAASKAKSPASLERKRMQNLKVFLAGSKELHRLRLAAPNQAMLIEKRLQAAYKANDRVRIASAKKDITMKLQAKRKADKDAADNKKRSERAIREQERAAEKKRRSDERDRRRREADDRRVLRQRQQQVLQAQKQRIQALKYMSGATGNIHGPVISGAAGAGTALTGAAITSAGELLDFRRAEAAARAALNTSGSTSDFADIARLTQRNADYYGITRAQHMRAYAQTRAAVNAKQLSDEQILFGNQSLAATSIVTGATTQQLDRAQIGLLQILTSGIQGQEIKQITENLTGAAPAVFSAISELTGKKVEGYGTVREMSERGELAGIKGRDFYIAFTRHLDKMYSKEFEKQRGTFPFEQRMFSSAVSNAKLFFATGFENEIVSGMMKLTEYLNTHEKEITAFGETVGAVFTKLLEVGTALYERLEPFLSKLYEVLMQTSAEDLADIAFNIGLIVAGLKALSIAASVALALKKLGKVLSFLGGASVLGGAAGAGGARGGLFGKLLGKLGSMGGIGRLLAAGLAIPGVRGAILAGGAAYGLSQTDFVQSLWGMLFPDEKAPSGGIPEYLVRRNPDGTPMTTNTVNSNNTVNQTINVNGGINDDAIKKIKEVSPPYSYHSSYHN